MAGLLAGLLALFSSAPAPLHLQGYVEGDYVRVGPPVAGTLAELDVREGDQVAKGARLFALDTVTDRAARDQAAARLARDQATLADMGKGKRPDELAAIAQKKARAEADERLSEITLKRQISLLGTGVASQAAVDQARAALARDRAQVAQLSADYRAALLGARQDRVDAQRDLVAEDRAQLAKADKRLADDAPPAPAAARVERVFYRPGEYVAAGQPVVSLLPPANVKLVFFVPEPVLGALEVGQKVAFACDGCRPGQTARISFIGSQVEYTPPVIYSVRSREKLVMRVEARSLARPLDLHPGQPVDVTLPVRR